MEGREPAVVASIHVGASLDNEGDHSGEGVQHEKVGISCDYPIGTTADPQLKYLVVLGIATG